MKENWLKELFINEAKPALERHSGGGDAADRYEEGYRDGHEVGVAEGIQSEYDKFWDVFQTNGTRLDYSRAFGDSGWNDVNFMPKYDIKATKLAAAFQNTHIVDLAGILQSLGLVLDTVGCTFYLQTFQGAHTKHIPPLDMTLSTNSNYAFGSGCKVEKIDKLIVSENTSFGDTTFQQACDLRDITFEGLIGVSITFQWSPLSTDSMKSVITHLKNYSGTDKASTYTITFSDACWAALETEGSTAPDGSTWRDYVEYTLAWLT